jgi:hypothetical protein
VLTGESPKLRSFLSWEFHSYGMEESNFRQAVRIGNMKGVRYGVNSKTELYDLDNDISENSNIASQHPDLVKKIEKIFEEEHAYSEHYPYGGYKRINRNE